MYRDELATAAQRIEQLQGQLTATEAEVRLLQERVARRARESSWPSRRRRMLMPAGVLGAIVVGGGALLGFTPWRAAAPPVRIGTAVVAVEPTSSAPATSARQLKRLPPRRRPSPPAGTRVIDFLTCSGCSCCVSGVFPPRFDAQDKFTPAADECRACARDLELAQAGLRVAGGSDDEHPLSASEGLLFRLDEPARLFALQVGPSWVRGGKGAPHQGEFSLTAYDTAGRPIDGARATYPVDSAKSHETLQTKRVLFVEACAGEAIGRVDLTAAGGGVHVFQIAVLGNVPL